MNAPDSVEKVVGEMDEVLAVADMGVAPAVVRIWRDRLAALGGEPVAWQMRYVGSAADYPERDWQICVLRPDAFYFSHPEYWQIRELVPALTTATSTPPPQALPALTDEEVAALGLCETAFSRKDGAFYDAHIATVCAALRRCYPKAGGG